MESGVVSSHPQRVYSLPAIVLHWVMALMIATLLVLGWYMVDLPRGPDRGATFALHKSIGLTVFALLLLRLAWRWFRPPPPLPAELPAWRRSGAVVAHVLLYLLMILQPVTGYLSSSFSGHGTTWFGLVELPTWAAKDAPLNQFFSDLHAICAVTLIALIAVHVSGALGHLFGREDHTFRRMWPWRGHRAGAS